MLIESPDGFAEASPVDSTLDHNPMQPPHPPGLTAAERHEAEALLAARCERRQTFAPGEVIARQGDASDGLHRVDHGAVNFLRIDRTGQSILFHVGLPGFWYGVGEHRALGGSRKPLHVVAASEVRLSSIGADAVDEIIASHDVVRRYMMSVLVNRYATLLDLVETGLKSNPEARLATRLLGFARLNTVPGPLPRTMEIPVLQATLSALTGVSRQTVNRALRLLVAAGAVQSVYGGVRIVDFRRLAEIAGVGADPFTGRDQGEGA